MLGKADSGVRGGFAPWSKVAVASALLTPAWLYLACGGMATARPLVGSWPLYYYHDAAWLAWRWVLPVTLAGASASLAGPGAFAVNLAIVCYLRGSRYHGRDIAIAMTYLAAGFSLVVLITLAFWAVAQTAPDPSWYGLWAFRKG